MGQNRKSFIIEEIEVLDFAAEGKCIARNEGEVIFINGANVAPGDRVKLFVTKSKKRFSEATVLNHISFSENRIKAFCDHFGICGGCKWQNVRKKFLLFSGNSYDNG